jgi:hypothetical protein
VVGLPFIVNTQQSAVEHWKKWWFIHIEYRNATKRLIASSSYILFTFEIPILMVVTPVNVALSTFLFSTLISPVSADNSHDLRLDAHSRSIDIDICIRCTSNIPRLPGTPW